MASIPRGKSLTGKPDAGNPPVRFGGRGGGNTPSLPLFYSTKRPKHIFLFFGGATVRSKTAARGIDPAAEKQNAFAIQFWI